MKKILLTALSFVLIAALALGGTLAYLMSEDEDVNVMVVGNVKIEQLEYERVTDANGNYVATDVTDEYGYTPDDLQEYTQAKVIVPAVYDKINWADDQQSWGEVGAPGSNQLFNDNMKNVQDKFVFVKNTGFVDAYYRTIVAVECPVGFDSSLLHLNVTGNSRFTWTDIGFITVDGVQYALKEALYNEILTPGEISRPSLLQVFLGKEATNEDVAKFNGTLDILVVSQGVQADGFDSAEQALDEAFYDVTVTDHPWMDGVKMPTLVYNAEELQNALDNAVNGDTVILGADIKGDVTVTQKPDVKITLDGNGKKLDGTITVDGKSRTYTTAGLTIKNVNFVADSISADACIRLGDGTNATRYTCNVTVSGCTFDVPGAVGVKSYTGGDKNLTITDCTATAKAHSLVQAKGIDGVLVEKCNVNSKNGLNFNNSDNVTIIGCDVDTQGYAVRFGESSGGSGVAETYAIKNCTLKSACDDGDAVIVLRGTADYATLTIENTTIEGNIEITNTATDATVVK